MFKKILKYISLFLLIISIILGLSIYISSLSSYTEEDFNIPSDFFETRHFDKDAESDENWFKDYVSFFKILNKYNKTATVYYSEKWEMILNEKQLSNHGINWIIELYNDNILKTIKKDNNKIIIKNNTTLAELDYFIDNYIWLENKSYFNNKLKYEIWKHYLKINPSIEENSNKNTEYLKLLEHKIESKNDEILIKNILDNYEKQTYKQLENFVRINSLKFKKINNYDFFKFQDKYKWINWADLNQTNLIQYIRLSHYVIYNYLQKWEYEIAIEILINNQLFIDSIIKKWDVDLMFSLTILFISEMNLQMFEYMLNNYIISNDLKDIIASNINNTSDNSFIINSIKNEYLDTIIECNSILKNHCDKMSTFTLASLNNNTYIDWKETFIEKLNIEIYKIKINILLYLFYSNDEEILLLQKYYYEVITNGDISTFSVNLNINNYIGRKYQPNIKESSLFSQFKKEEELQNLRNKVLKQLKTD